MRLKAASGGGRPTVPMACSAAQLWRALVVVLVLVISILQVVHIALLSRLEARRSRDVERRSVRPGGGGSNGGGFAQVADLNAYGPTEMAADRARMVARVLDESAVLDASGEFSLVHNLQPASPPAAAAALPLASSSSDSTGSGVDEPAYLQALGSGDHQRGGGRRRRRRPAMQQQQQRDRELDPPSDAVAAGPPGTEMTAAGGGKGRGGTGGTAGEDELDGGGIGVGESFPMLSSSSMDYRGLSGPGAEGPMCARAGSGRPACVDDVSLVTQTSVGHLGLIGELAARWRGPLSVAVFAGRRGELPDLVDILLQLRFCYPAVRHNVSFHLVYPLHSKPTSRSFGSAAGAVAGSLERGGASRVSPSHSSTRSADAEPPQCSAVSARLRQLESAAPANYDDVDIAYPVNLLRNVARTNARSQFVFVVDIDLQVSEGLHDAFVSFARANGLFSRSEHTDAFVVPAFEAAENVPLPRCKSELLTLIETGAARPFYEELCYKCHKHTDYEAWKRAPTGRQLEVLFQVTWKDPWEPFYIAHNSAPLFDERFRQYGFNRISQACEMHVAGYSFSVLNNAFIVHRGLKRPGEFHREKNRDLEKNRLNFRQFKTELKERYKDSPKRCY